ncbi:hypothetical protein FGB62_5g322 [Gracilaria domingensis]|nr:hypothetical protein FGB62_5g322 [Gracilaria domingensis]
MNGTSAHAESATTRSHTAQDMPQPNSASEKHVDKANKADSPMQKENGSSQAAAVAHAKSCEQHDAVNSVPVDEAIKSKHDQVKASDGGENANDAKDTNDEANKGIHDQLKASDSGENANGAKDANDEVAKNSDHDQAEASNRGENTHDANVANGESKKSNDDQVKASNDANDDEVKASDGGRAEGKRQTVGTAKGNPRHDRAHGERASGAAVRAGDRDHTKRTGRERAAEGIGAAGDGAQERGRQGPERVGVRGAEPDVRTGDAGVCDSSRHGRRGAGQRGGRRGGRGGRGGGGGGGADHLDAAGDRARDVGETGCGGQRAAERAAGGDAPHVGRAAGGIGSGEPGRGRVRQGQ